MTLYRRAICTLLATGLAGLILAGCNTGSTVVNPFIPIVNNNNNNNNNNNQNVELGTASAFLGITQFPQTVAAQDGDGELFPGQANVWDLNNDFSLNDGNDDQWDDALELQVGVTNFDDASNLQAADLQWFTPFLGTANGLVPAVQERGQARINQGGDIRLSQTLNLTAAVAPVTLNFTAVVANTDGGDFGTNARFEVFIRDANGNALNGGNPVATTADGSLVGGANTVDLSAFVGQTVVLSFENKENNQGDTIDDVSVTDNTATEFVTNGGFDNNLVGWTASGNESQNVTHTTPVVVEGLTVTRSFYTEPNKLWGRWVDVFQNNTGAAITQTVSYLSNLGSDDAGIIYRTPGANNRGLTSYDGDASDRDVGMVFGDGANVQFVSDLSLGQGDGSEDIIHRYQITVAPGQSVAIVNFIVMNGVDTGQSATNPILVDANGVPVDANDRAAAIDAEVARIANGFNTNAAEFKRGMTQAQINAVINFNDSNIAARGSTFERGLKSVKPREAKPPKR